MVFLFVLFFYLVVIQKASWIVIRRWAVPRALHNFITKQPPFLQPEESAWTLWAALVHSYRRAHSRRSAPDRHSQKSHDIHGSFPLVSFASFTISFFCYCASMFQSFFMLCSSPPPALVGYCSENCEFNECHSFTFINIFQLNHKRTRLEKQLIAF